jgi:hypothetical protein
MSFSPLQVLLLKPIIEELVVCEKATRGWLSALTWIGTVIIYVAVLIAQSHMSGISLANDGVRRITSDKSLFDTRTTPFTPLLFEAKVMVSTRTSKEITVLPV